MKEIAYAVHLTSLLELSSNDTETEMDQPNVKGTANILASALQTASIERVIMISPLVSAMAYSLDPKDVITAESKVPTVKGQFTEPFSTCCASKIDALHSIDDEVKSNKSFFDIINIISGFVFGRTEMANDTISLTRSNRLMLAMLQEQIIPVPRIAGAANLACM